MRIMKRFLLILGFCWTAVPAQALWTGNDQYDRKNLNSERLVDAEYLTDLLAFRPFWEPAPMARRPKASIRTTEGSLTTDYLYIRREADVRLAVSSGTWFAYHLRQLEDLEQESLDQFFGLRTGWASGPGLRVMGQPTGEKQNSDIGFGLDWISERLRVAAMMRFVDFNFNSKNRDGNRDRKDLTHWRVETGWKDGDLAMEAFWDLDSPLDREFTDDDERLSHRAWQAAWSGAYRRWSSRAFWQNHRRALDTLSTGQRQQDFHQQAGGLRLDYTAPLHTRHTLRPGLQWEYRSADFSGDTLPIFREKRWFAVPFLEFDYRITERVMLPFGLYTAMSWERHQTARPVEWKLRTPLRVDFTPDIGLVLNATWDLDDIGSTRTFDGGNAQFQGRFF